VEAQLAGGTRGTRSKSSHASCATRCDSPEGTSSPFGGRRRPSVCSPCLSLRQRYIDAARTSRISRGATSISRSKEDASALVHPFHRNPVRPRVFVISLGNAGGAKISERRCRRPRGEGEAGEMPPTCRLLSPPMAARVRGEVQRQVETIMFQRFADTRTALAPPAIWQTALRPQTLAGTRPAVSSGSPRGLRHRLSRRRTGEASNWDRSRQNVGVGAGSISWLKFAATTTEYGLDYPKLKDRQHRGRRRKLPEAPRKADRHAVVGNRSARSHRDATARIRPIDTTTRSVGGSSRCSREPHVSWRRTATPCNGSSSRTWTCEILRRRTTAVGNLRGEAGLRRRSGGVDSASRSSTPPCRSSHQAHLEVPVDNA